MSVKIRVLEDKRSVKRLNPLKERFLYLPAIIEDLISFLLRKWNLI